MQTDVIEKLYTVNEYLALEKRAKNKHEYYNGKIVRMPGASFKHNIIAANIISMLNAALYEKSFFVLNSDMKIHIPQLESFVYPDAVVIFEKPLFYEGRTDVVLNPLLIVEVASRSTRNYDRTTKFEYYKTLPSFKEYVLIEQTKPWVIASYKIAERTWQDTEASSLNDSIYLRSVDCTIELNRVYHGVPFDKVV